MDLDREDVYLLLGSNLGDSKKMLLDAIACIQADAGVLVAQSSFYETAAWGKTDQPTFINIAVQIATRLTPQQLLTTLLNIEKQLGRVRDEKWGARLIDIDIIFYGNKIVNDIDLKLPHPEMQNRKFVLAPLAEIAPNFIHPMLRQSTSQLLASIDDDLPVLKLDKLIAND